MKKTLMQYNSTETGLSPVSVESIDIKDKKVKQKRRKEELFCKGVKLRLYPTKEQDVLLRQWIGSSRYVWNWALNRYNQYQEQYYLDLKNGIDVSKRKKNLSFNEISQDLTVLKKQNEFSWLDQVPRTVLTNALNHLKASTNAYFDGIKGKRKDKPGKPKFRKRLGSNETACFQIDPRHKKVFDQVNNTLKIPGLGEVKLALSEAIDGEISNISVKRKHNQWFVSLSLINVSSDNIKRKDNSHKYKTFLDHQTDQSFFKKKEGLIALDASVRSGGVAYDGKNVCSVFNENVLRSNEKFELKKEKYQKAYSRKQEKYYNSLGIFRTNEGGWPKNLNALLKQKSKQKNTHRMEKLQEKIQLLSLKEVFRKNDAIHKFTTEIIRNNHTIVLETLELKEMAKSTLGTTFRRRMHDACMGEIKRQIVYKSEWHNRTVIFVDKYFASSKICSTCKEKNKDLHLEHVWTCSKCKQTHQRDENASFNLWQEGWRLLEEYFNKNDTSMLAAGSAVRGTQGLLFKVEKPNVKPMVKKALNKTDKKSLPQVFRKSKKMLETEKAS